MAEEKSIYERIKEAMTAEGIMPEGFVLRERLRKGCFCLSCSRQSLRWWISTCLWRACSTTAFSFP